MAMEITKLRKIFIHKKSVGTGARGALMK